MPMIPLYIQPQQGTATAAGRISAFNFCNPFDHVLPIPGGSVSAADRAHLWGHYSEFFDSGGVINIFRPIFRPRRR